MDCDLERVLTLGSCAISKKDVGGRCVAGGGREKHGAWKAEQSGCSADELGLVSCHPYFLIGKGGDVDKDQ